MQPSEIKVFIIIIIMLKYFLHVVTNHRSVVVRKLVRSSPAPPPHFLI